MHCLYTDRGHSLLYLSNSCKTSKLWRRGRAEGSRSRRGRTPRRGTQSLLTRAYPRTILESKNVCGGRVNLGAHDFNNTLAGILGRAQLLLETTEPAKIESGLNIIIKTAKDGAKTVRRIQDFARQRRDHYFQMVDVQQLLGDVAEITRPRWKNLAEAANIHINLELACADGLLVMGDESELREVLVNMVFNAVDAMPQGGRLTLAAKETNDLIEISVHDTGTGMTEETRLRVFDPFFTTKDMLGMGLGLAVSYGIICRHEGTVEVESEVGAGTTFRVRLPIGKPAAKKQLIAGLPIAVEPHFKSGGTKILVVDDEEYVRDLLRDILEHQGCEVVVAAGGREALSLFESGDFDAVFTDVGMPDMNGWELSRSRAATQPQDSGSGDHWMGRSRRPARATGSADRWVVAKPFDAPA